MCLVIPVFFQQNKTNVSFREIAHLIARNPLSSKRHVIFQQCGILTSKDSDEPVQPPFKLRNSKCCSFSSLTIIEFSSYLQKLWSDCVYAQADLSLCWSHISHCWKSHLVLCMIPVSFSVTNLIKVPHKSRL